MKFKGSGANVYHSRTVVGCCGNTDRHGKGIGTQRATVSNRERAEFRYLLNRRSLGSLYPRRPINHRDTRASQLISFPNTGPLFKTVPEVQQLRLRAPLRPRHPGSPPPSRNLYSWNRGTWPHHTPAILHMEFTSNLLHRQQENALLLSDRAYTLRRVRHGPVIVRGRLWGGRLEKSPGVWRVPAMCGYFSRSDCSGAEKSLGTYARHAGWLFGRKFNGGLGIPPPGLLLSSRTLLMLICTDLRFLEGCIAAR